MAEAVPLDLVAGSLSGYCYVVLTSIVLPIIVLGPAWEAFKASKNYSRVRGVKQTLELWVRRVEKEKQIPRVQFSGGYCRRSRFQ